jgi:hypothetical protein
LLVDELDVERVAEPTIEAQHVREAALPAHAQARWTAVRQSGRPE